MDDILSQLSDFLSTDEGKEQLNNIAAMFSGGGEADPHNGKDSPAPAPASEKSNISAPTNLLPDGMSIDMIMKLAPLISKLGSASDDKNSRLIMALKPHLRPENRHRADEAAQFLKLLSLLPSLKDLDLF